MNLRRVVLSFLVTSIVAAPLILTAEEEGEPTVQVAPRFVDHADVASLHLKAKVVSSTRSAVRIHLTGRNAGDAPVEASVEVVARRAAKGSEFARMMPKPEIVARRAVPLVVAPGAEVDQIVTIDGLKLGNKRALKRRPIHAAVYSSDKDANAAMIDELGPSARLARR